MLFYHVCINCQMFTCGIGKLLVKLLVYHLGYNLIYHDNLYLKINKSGYIPVTYKLLNKSLETFFRDEFHS